MGTQFNCEKHFYFKLFSFVKQLYFEKFSLVSTQFSSIQPIDRALSGTTTPDQCGPGSNANEGVLPIP